MTLTPGQIARARRFVVWRLRAWWTLMLREAHGPGGEGLP